MSANEILEAVIYKPSTGGYVPHIKVKRELINKMGGNFKVGGYSTLKTLFPQTITKLAEVGIDNKGRELYDKGLLGKKITNNLEEAQIARELYQEVINTI